MATVDNEKLENGSKLPPNSNNSAPTQNIGSGKEIKSIIPRER